MLDALWGTHDRLLPLLKSFPEGVWKVEAGRFMSPLTVIVFFSPNRAVEEVFQETPDEGGMEPFAKIRSGDAGAQALRSHPTRKRSWELGRESLGANGSSLLLHVQHIALICIFPGAMFR